MFRGTVLQIATYLLVVCLLSITFLVFVNASVSFVITDILGKREHVGDDVGTLGFVDELVAMIACPLWGMLSDRIGTRLVLLVSYLLVAISLFCFVNTSSVFPGLLLVRILFSVGGAGAATMVTAILPSITESKDHQLKAPSAMNSASSGCSPLDDSHPSQLHEPTDVQPPRTNSGSFRIAGLVGTAAGCGALVAVFGFLRLPPYFQDQHLTPETALRDTFYIVSVVAFVAAISAFLGLRDLAGVERVSITKEKSGLGAFLDMPYSATQAAVHNHAIGLAYLGGFVARAASVGISLFIPLWINAFYIQSGRCRIDDPSNASNECRDAYKLSSAITGVSQLAVLVCAPLFGFISERLRQRRAPLLLASAAGVVGYAILTFIKDPRIHEGTIGPAIFVVAILLGMSQVGAIVCSLGLLGHAIATSKPETAHLVQSAPSTTTLPESRDEAINNSSTPLLSQVEPSTGWQRSTLSNHGTQTYGKTSLREIKGSIAGLYSFGGGVGILLLTKIGGHLFDDTTPVAPFWLLVAFNALLFLGASASILSSTLQRVHQQ